MRMQRLTISLFVLIALASSTRSAAAEQQTLVVQPQPLAVSSAVLASTRWTPYGSVDSEPSTGNGQVIAGWIIGGLGVLNLAMIPVCYASFYPKDARSACVGLSIGIGIVGLGVGLPLLLVGYHNRAEHEAWRKRDHLALLLSRIALTPLPDGGALTFRTPF